ncbi:hypothetical protein C9I47_2265 [Lysobacter maris]|uniref:Uncharacterized protein n=1 Tax=Marilutibacter maris TaxID=1605891 RepID=A0A2U9TBK6_9GAMM|nr:hypothetical protein C9I47_2265 [Lysobacter maris]
MDSVEIVNGRQIRDSDQAEVIGNGPHRYCFEFWPPAATAPAARTPFALALTGEVPLPAELHVYQGVTDAHGRTPVFALDRPVEPGAWRLTGRLGEGEFGDVMRLRASDGTPQAGRSYLLVICSASPQWHRGRTDTAGRTVYAAAPQPEHIMLNADPETASKPDEVRALELCGGSADR